MFLLKRSEATLSQKEKERQDEVEIHRSKAVRLLYAALGILCVVLGAIGAVLPLLPTTVFVLLAAFFFARSSRRFYTALLESKHFGPLIRNWRRHRCLSRRNKIRAISAIAVTFGITVGFFVEGILLQVVLVSLAIGLSLCLYQLPNCEDTADEEKSKRV